MTSATAATAFAPPSYAPSLRWLHWVIAVLIFTGIALGVTVIYLPRGVLRSEMLEIHKSIGMTVLALVVLRVLARLTLGAPSYLPPLDWLARHASSLGHLALYALMFGLPISGYVGQSAAGHSLDWFGLFAFPIWVAPDSALNKLASETHYIFAWGIGALLVAHLGAVVWHSLVKRDNVLQRMWPRSAGARNRQLSPLPPPGPARKML